MHRTRHRTIKEEQNFVLQPMVAQQVPENAGKETRW